MKAFLAGAYPERWNFASAGAVAFAGMAWSGAYPERWS